MIRGKCGCVKCSVYTSETMAVFNDGSETHIHTHTHTHTHTHIHTYTYTLSVTYSYLFAYIYSTWFLQV